MQPRLPLRLRGLTQSPRTGAKPRAVGRAWPIRGAARAEAMRWGSGLRFFRRHPIFRIVRLDPPNEWALVGITRNDRRAKLCVGRVSKVGSIQTQACFARRRIKPMAGVAIFRKDGLNGLVERHLCGTGLGVLAVAATETKNRSHGGDTKRYRSTNQARRSGTFRQLVTRSHTDCLACQNCRSCFQIWQPTQSTSPPNIASTNAFP